MKSLVSSILVMASVLWAQNPPLKFQGFDGTFVTMGGMAGAFAEFTLTVDYAPFHFTYRGKVNAGVDTRDLKQLLEDVVIVVSYFDAPVQGISGGPRVAALSEAIFLLSDEPAKLDGGSFTLLPPLAGNSSAVQALSQVPAYVNAYNMTGSRESREADEDSEITVAAADPWNKDFKDMEVRAALDAIQKRQADSLRTVQAMERRRTDSLEAARRAALAPPVKKSKIKKMKPKPEPTPVYEDPFNAQEQAAPVRKTRKKKKPAATASRDYGDADWADSEPSSRTGVKDQEFRNTMGWVGAGVAGLGAIATYKFQSDAAKANTEFHRLNAIYQASGGTDTNIYNAAINAQNQKSSNETKRNISIVGFLLAAGFSVTMFNF